MLAKYIQIKSEYDKFYNRLLSQGRLPIKDTGVGYWGISVADDLFELFKRIKLDKHKNFLDLGSGDGKVVMIASLFTKATGIEADEELHNFAKEIKKKLKTMAGKASLINENFYDHDISKYDVIFYNPDQNPEKISPKFSKELKGKLIVYGPHFHPENLKKETSFFANTTQVTIYTKE